MSLGDQVSRESVPGSGNKVSLCSKALRLGAYLVYWRNS